MTGDRVAEIAARLEAAWDAGNCTGLDGWIGPARGAGEVDDEALHARDRDVATHIEPLLAEFESSPAPEVIHLCDPAHGPSYCGEPVTIIHEAGDTRPVCQACHRGAMKSVREGYCPCVGNRPQDCKPEQWPFSVRHGLLAEIESARGRLAAVEAMTVTSHMVHRDAIRAALATGEGEDHAE